MKEKLKSLNDARTEKLLRLMAEKRSHLSSYADIDNRVEFISKYKNRSFLGLGRKPIFSRSEKLQEIWNGCHFTVEEEQNIQKAVFPLLEKIRNGFLVLVALFMLYIIGGFFIYRSLPKVYAIGSMVEVYRDPSCQQKNMQQISLFGKGVNNEKNEAYMILKDSTATSYKVIDAGFFGWLFNTATPKYIKKAETTMEIAPYEKILEPLKNEQDLFDLTAEDRKAIKRAFDKPEFAGASIAVGNIHTDTTHYIVAFDLSDTSQRVILFSVTSKRGNYFKYIIHGTIESCGNATESGHKPIKMSPLIVTPSPSQGNKIKLYDYNINCKYYSISSPYYTTDYQDANKNSQYLH